MEDKPKGIERLRLAVLKDCINGRDCFNENGCDIQTRAVDDPVRSRPKGCFHLYCDQYKWILARAEIYAKKLNMTRDQIIEIWEEHRSYWYMNYYQDGNQPDISDPAKNIMLHDDWGNECIKRFGEDPRGWKFKCPRCGHVQSGNDFIAAGIKYWQDCYTDCIGRYVKGVGCDWTLGGLFQIHKLSVLKDGRVFPVFELADADPKNVQAII